jgi:hypothetical protein
MNERPDFKYKRQQSEISVTLIYKKRWTNLCLEIAYK